MKRSTAAIMLAALAGILGLQQASAAEIIDNSPSKPRQRELIRLIRSDCMACHGADFKGGIGPALTPKALAPKSVEAVQSTILHGRQGTPMPAWTQDVTAAEARWLAERLKEGFPY